MQGKKLVVQPSVDDFGNILLWNGDIFSGIYKKASEDVGDTAALLRALAESTPAGICSIFSQVTGPWSVIYWSQSKKTLWFGRDPLGRHSLLWCKNDSSIILTSVAERGHLDIFLEVPAIGLFALDFNSSDPDSIPDSTLYPWSHLMPELTFGKHTCFEQLPGNCDGSSLKFSIANDIIKSQIDLRSHTDKMEGCQALPNEDIAILPANEALFFLRKSWANVDNRLEMLLEILKKSVKTRVQTEPGLCKNCIKGVRGVDDSGIRCPHPKICVLFSGGIDSTILTLLVDLFVPAHEAIDLLNVAFAKGKRDEAMQDSEVSDERYGNEPDGEVHKKRCSKKEVSTKGLSGHTFSDVPDRITGKQALEELAALCPTRMWNFVEIDVTVEELSEIRREYISDLIHPLNTVLDDSLGCAMWFAGRGCGTLYSIRGADGKESFSISENYTSPARVAILGNGADEQLGGYSRHRSALEDGGWPLLATEISRQVKNLPSRNLGRDDRIISDHGRQPRFPFLDEAVVSYLSSLPPWEKVAASSLTSKKKNSETLGRTPLTMKTGVGDKALLRLLALKMGLKNVCTFPKRAMQFGTRVAKLEATGKEKASDVCQRLKIS
ncbi:asparagine synthetase domain-containing protein 1 isoform X2 [Hetaerina americana]